MRTWGSLITKLKYLQIMFGPLKSERLAPPGEVGGGFGESESRQLLYLHAGMWKAAGAQINKV